MRRGKVKNIQKYVDDLVELMVDKGTPPFVLANNISRDNYLEVNLSKIDSKIIVMTKYLRNSQVVTFKYYYTENEVLYKKEITENNTNYVYWNRKEEMKKLVNKIAKLTGYKKFSINNSENIDELAKQLLEKVS
jgi:hypothetical protein